MTEIMVTMEEILSSLNECILVVSTISNYINKSNMCVRNSIYLN